MYFLNQWCVHCIEGCVLTVTMVTVYPLCSPSDATVPNDTSPLRNKDLVELVHVGTKKLLNSHDVAAPLTPANQEIAGYINYSSKFVPNLEWRLVN